MFRFLSLCLLVSIINCDNILVDTDATTTVEATINSTTTTTKLTTVVKPIVDTTFLPDHENKSAHRILTADGAPNLVDKTKFVVKPANQTTDETFINLHKSNTSGSSLYMPLTLIIVVVGVVFVIIVVIISGLFIMRRRFSKWRLNIMDTNGATNLNNEGGGGGKNGDNLSHTEDVLISKQDSQQQQQQQSSSETNTGTDSGHTNEAVSTSQSTDSIKIENEINKAISEISAAVTDTNTNIETVKLLDQQQQPAQLVIGEETSEVKKSNVKLNDDIEKQPLNHDDHQ